MGTHIAETGNLGLEYADLKWEPLPFDAELFRFSNQKYIICKGTSLFLFQKLQRAVSPECIES